MKDKCGMIGGKMNNNDGSVESWLRRELRKRFEEAGNKWLLRNAFFGNGIDREHQHRRKQFKVINGGTTNNHGA